MTVPPPSAITIEAPAKLNLGLEILGRREDGYHDLSTIFVTVNLRDTLNLTSASGLQLLCNDQTLADDENLVLHAARLLQTTAASLPGASIALQKEIPIAAGLGGASSDAAAALIAARTLWDLETSDGQLAQLAACLGSDVSFFLNGGCALGEGRGELLTSLPLPKAWFVVVAPTLAIPRKTASLYAALQPSDLSDGARVAAQVARLNAGLCLDRDLLGNAFTRPLYERLPELAPLPVVMHRAGAPVVALSGAGPAHYAVVDDPERASQIAARLRSDLRNAARVFVVTPVPERSLSPADYDVS